MTISSELWNSHLESLKNIILLTLVLDALMLVFLVLEKRDFLGTLENFLNIFSFLEQRWVHYSSLRIVSFPPELFGHYVIQSTYMDYFKVVLRKGF